jgi:hypothetical protein
VYFLIFYQKYTTRGPKEDLANLLGSIVKMSYQQQQRKRMGSDLKLLFKSSNQIGSIEAQRNYDPFFHSSSDYNELMGSSNIGLWTISTPVGPSLPGQWTEQTGASQLTTYLDYLYTQHGVVKIENLIHNMTIPLTDQTFDRFMFNHLIILGRGQTTASKDMKLIFDNPQHAFLIDLLSMNVEIRRINPPVVV